MRMCVIFIILLKNYEKAVHAHNYRFLWKGLCFNYLISPLYGSKVGLFEGNLFWVAQYKPTPPPSSNLHIGKKTNAILITIINI